MAEIPNQLGTMNVYVFLYHNFSKNLIFEMVYEMSIFSIAWLTQGILYPVHGKPYVIYRLSIVITES